MTKKISLSPWYELEPKSMVRYGDIICGTRYDPNKTQPKDVPGECSEDLGSNGIIVSTHYDVDDCSYEQSIRHVRFHSHWKGKLIIIRKPRVMPGNPHYSKPLPLP